VGQPFWRDAGVEGSIDLRIGKAAETLDTLVKENESGAYGFAFIDGDKTFTASITSNAWLWSVPAV
jgi:O-methyltransferase